MEAWPCFIGNKFMQRKIIIFISVLFIASSFWLFYQNNKQTDLNLNKNWWEIYFIDPKSDSLDFIIENYSNEIDFHWEVLAGKEKIKEGDTKIEKSKKTEINPVLNSNFKDEKITIAISAGDEKKEIYKNFEK